MCGNCRLHAQSSYHPGIEPRGIEHLKPPPDRIHRRIFCPARKTTFKKADGEVLVDERGVRDARGMPIKSGALRETIRCCATEGGAWLRTSRYLRSHAQNLNYIPSPDRPPKALRSCDSHGRGWRRRQPSTRGAAQPNGFASSNRVWHRSRLICWRSFAWWSSLCLATRLIAGLLGTARFLHGGLIGRLTGHR